MTSITKLPDGRYKARPIIEGKKHYIVKDTKGAVARDVAKLQEQAYRRRLGLPGAEERPEDVTLNQLCDRFLAQYGRSERSKRTIEERLLYGRRAFGDALIRELTPDGLAAWYASMTRADGTTPLGVAGRYAAWRTLRQVLRFAVRRRLLYENPTDDVEIASPRARPVRPFESWAEIHRVAEFATTYGPLIRFACATGLRPQEWMALEWQHIDPQRGELRVEQTIRSGKIAEETKTEESRRVVKLQREALDALAELPRPVRGGLIFPSPNGKPWNLSNFRRRIWKPALEAAGVEYRAVDQTRHTFATLALAAGAELAWVSRQLGHTKLQTTLKHYARWLPETEERNLAALDAFAAKNRTETGQSEEATSDA